MPYGGNDWLALTQEPTLEPEIPICDPHHHLWDFRSERIPYQRYLLHELAADVNCGHNVRSTVFIEVKARYRTDAATSTSTAMQQNAEMNSYMLPQGVRRSARPRARIEMTWAARPVQVSAKAARSHRPCGPAPGRGMTGS